MKYEGEDLNAGADLLSQFLDCIQNSAAIYTLCVYEEYSGKINDKTPYHGSWNFRFQESTQSYKEGGIAISKQIALLTEKVEKLSAVTEEDEPEDPVLDTMDRIGAIANHPLVEQFLPMILGAIGVKLPGMQQNDKPVGAIMAGLSDAAVVSPALITAVRKMITAVPSCEKKLIELGEIAEKDPNKFAKLVGYLNLI
jgi:hypothetical protein